MSTYTTGELAKLCEVSVRTVQFYDEKDLLKPAELTEGGRRLYSDDGLITLRLICLLKSLGLSLDSIRGILHSENQNKVLLTLLDEQEKQIDAEMDEKQKQKLAIGVIRENLRTVNSVSVNSISDIEKTVTGKRKLKKTYAVMLIVGIPMDMVEIGTLVYGIVKGVWWPFIAGMAAAVVAAWLLVRMYYRNTAYICPECGKKFRPAFGEFTFAKHTSKTRKLTCTSCRYKGYCIETYADVPEGGR
jgi:DNA-binding transcriptional MerR regulator/DNA-directed RNA polymerase subunit RPC12/RpoP